MKIYIPQNIFTAIWALGLPDEFKSMVQPINASLVAKTLEEDINSVGLIPSFDLLNHKELVVSNTHAISFDGQLSTSYLYFKPDEYSMNKILLKGDVSTNEIILGKLIFAEMTGTQPEMVLDTKEMELENNHYLVAGDANFSPPLVNGKGMSFADQTAVFLDHPYVNYVLAGKEGELVKELTKHLTEFDKKIEDNAENFLDMMGYNEDIIEFIMSNFNSVYYELTENEIEGLHELLRLPYYKGMIEDIVEVKFT